MELTCAWPQLHLKCQFLSITVMTVGEGNIVTVSIKCLEFCLHKYYKLIKSKILKKMKTQKYRFSSYIENWLKVFHEDLKKHEKWSSKKLLECSFILKSFSTIQVQNTKKSNEEQLLQNSPLIFNCIITNKYIKNRLEISCNNCAFL